MARRELGWPELLTATRIVVRVKTGAPETRLLGRDDDGRYLVALHAQPIAGRANAELERFFSRLTKRPWRLKSGATSKTKVLTASQP